MKTKYILHGGAVWPQTESNKSYYQEMVKGLIKPRTLLVYFAREDKEIPEYTQRDKSYFAWANPGLDATFIVATEDKFVEQVRDNDVIFLEGGKTSKLIDTVKRTGLDLKQAFEGKTVAGSSAGAYLISQWYYTNSGKEIRQGLGLLPIGVWAHYRPEKGTEFWMSEEETKAVEEEMLTHVSEDKFIKLPEQEMVVFE